MWEQRLNGRPIDFIKSSCCPEIEYPDFCVEVGSKPPKMLNWKCHTKDRNEKPLCSECGSEKQFRASECDALLDCLTEIPVKEWKLAPRTTDTDGNVTSTQIELSESELPISEVVKRLHLQLEICRTHFGETSWINCHKGIDSADIPVGSAIIFTNFSASLDLRAGETDNSSIDAHAVLDIFVVCHSQRTVDGIRNRKGNLESIRVNDCDVWYLFGDSKSKGKKNDHVFHNACLDHLLEHYKRVHSIKDAKIWTDNCGGQYKCNQNFFKIATSAERNGVGLKHRFAQKYGFKGIWDAAGKVVKHEMRNEELVTRNGKHHRFANAWDCYFRLRPILKDLTLKLRKKKPWAEWEREKSSKLLDKTPFKLTERYIGYVTEDPLEFQRLEFRHVVFSNRTSPKWKPSKGLKAALCRWPLGRKGCF